MPIRVLVVDDSILMRAKITEMLERDGDIKVIATASNGLDALDKIPRLTPDVVTLDVQMPQLDGIATLKQIMETCPARVVLLTGHTTYAGEETVRALEMGAIDYVLKPSGSLSLDIEKIQEELRSKVRLAMQVDVGRLAGVAAPKLAEGVAAKGLGKVVVIGASTGGPRALNALMPQIAASLPAAIIIVQHMPALFTASFAEHLNFATKWNVSEGVENDELKNGCLFVAPGGRHLDLATEGDRILLRPVPVDRVKGHYIPSITFTMKRAAELFGSRAVGVILTGMGDDGVEGLAAIRKAGGRTIAESEESAIVFGMPRVAAEKGVADLVLPLGQIAVALANIILE